MKFLEKFTLIVYSYIVLIISVILCLLVFNWLNLGIVEGIIEAGIKGGISSNIILAVSIIFILLSIKNIFFNKYESNNSLGQGVLLENENGKLMISKETLENLVNSVAKGFDSTNEITTKIELDNENNVNVYANLVVNSNAVIKDLSSNLQTRIKEKIKNATDLDVKEVNIKIKNVAPNNKEAENK